MLTFPHGDPLLLITSCQLLLEICVTAKTFGHNCLSVRKKPVKLWRSSNGYCPKGGTSHPGFSFLQTPLYHHPHSYSITAVSATQHALYFFNMVILPSPLWYHNVIINKTQLTIRETEPWGTSDFTSHNTWIVQETFLSDRSRSEIATVIYYVNSCMEWHEIREAQRWNQRTYLPL